MEEKKELTALQRWILKILSILLCTVYSVFLAGLVELSVRGDLHGVMTFFLEGTTVSYLNLLIPLLIIGLFYAISNRVWVSFTCSLILFGLIGLVNIGKIKFHDMPFLPWDIFLFEDALRVAPALKSQMMDEQIKMYLTVAGGMLAAALFAWILIDRISRKGRRDIVDYLLNIGIAVLCVFLLHALSFENPRRAEFFREQGIVNYFWNQKENMENNGEILTFTMNLSNIIVSKPQTYTKEKVVSLDEQVGKLARSGREKPDIVVIMSESFSDPVKIEGMEFSKDPLPHFREIGEEGLHGDFYVSVIGGKTANTEFEFLTGYSVRLLPEGSVPYQQHIKNEIRSLPRFLKEKGYYTTAIHNNVPEFWNRKKVYEYMGFDRFLDITDFKDAKFFGNWMSDKDLTDKVIEALEEDKGKPNNFVFAVTVQNHAPYDTPAEVEDIEITKIKGEISPADLDLMKKYLRGISVSDEELYRLYEYLKEREKPTVLCFFGDHLPGGFEKLYRTFPYYANAKKANSRPELLSTPYIIWSNFKSEPRHLDIGGNAAAALMLDYAEGDIPAIQNYNYTQYAKMDGEKVYYQLENLKGDLKTLRENQYLLMYDDLFGKKYYNIGNE